MNNQPKEPINRREDGKVYVHSIFSTIQGEGPFAGHRATFVRLAGCNLDCPFCDTIYTGDAVELLDPEEIYDIITTYSDNTLIVITGGEPFRQNLTKLVSKLKYAGLNIQIETNGTLHDPSFPYPFVTTVVSPKNGKLHKKLIPHVRHYKYVAEADKIDLSDGLPIEVLGNRVRQKVARPPWNLRPVVYLQPMDSGDETQNRRNMSAVVASCLAHGHILCLQLHKIVGLE